MKSKHIKLLPFLLLAIHFIQNNGNFSIGYFEQNYSHSPAVIISEISQSRLATKDINIEINWPCETVNYLSGPDKIIVDVEIVSRHSWKTWVPFGKFFIVKSKGICYLGSRDNYLGAIELNGKVKAVGLCPRSRVLKLIEKSHTRKIVKHLQETQIPIDNLVKKDQRNIKEFRPIAYGQRVYTTTLGNSHILPWFGSDYKIPYVLYSLKNDPNPRKDTLYFKNYFNSRLHRQDSSLAAYQVIEINPQDSMLKFTGYYLNNQKECEGFYKDFYGKFKGIANAKCCSIDFLYSWGIWRNWRSDGTLRREEHHLEKKSKDTSRRLFSKVMDYDENGKLKMLNEYEHSDSSFNRIYKLISEKGKVLEVCKSSGTWDESSNPIGEVFDCEKFVSSQVITKREDDSEIY